MNLAKTKKGKGSECSISVKHCLQETPVDKAMTDDTVSMKSAKSRIRKTLKGNCFINKLQRTKWRGSYVLKGLRTYVHQMLCVARVCILIQKNWYLKNRQSGKFVHLWDI